MRLLTEYSVGMPNMTSVNSAAMTGYPSGPYDDTPVFFKEKWSFYIKDCTLYRKDRYEHFE